MEKKDRVQMVHAPDIASQAAFVAKMIRQILDLNPDLKQEDIAVVSRLGISYPPLVALRMALAQEKINFSYPMKNNSGFPMIRIREIQMFIRYLDSIKKESRRPSDLKQAVMGGLFQQKNTWTSRVEEILESWCRINSDMEIRVAHAREFALETLLEERQEHRSGGGVFMGTVHSVKGMEFPVVFILDGGWKNQDMEEERRLFYVGMTRAKTRLFLCRVEALDNPHLFSLKDEGFIHHLPAPPAPVTGFSEDLTVSILGMADLYIGYPGLFPAGHEIHQNLAAIETGAKITLMEQKGRVYILNDAGKKISALSKKGAGLWRPHLDQIITARVLGLVQRQRQDEDEKARPRAGVESWELPVLEALHKKFKIN